MSKKLDGHKNVPKQVNIAIDLDGFDLATVQGQGGIPLVRLEFTCKGKRTFVIVDLFQHEMRPYPSLRVTAIGKSKDTIKELPLKPWASTD